MRTIRKALKLFVTAWLCVLSGAHVSHGGVALAAAANGVTAGDFLIDPPTLINLGFEWFIEGDDNRNASVEVTFRKTGAAQWSRALPLLRLQGERIYNGAQLDVVSPNMF